MREVVSIHIGGCGSGLAAAFWESLADEHGLGPCGQYQGTSQLQLTNIDGFFDEISGGRYVPRAVFCDLDPRGLTRLRNWPVGHLFRPSHLVTGDMDASNNFAKGFNLKDNDTAHSSMKEAMRQELELCSCVQSVHVTHSISGGSGSGLTSRLLADIHDEFKVPARAFTLFPSPNSAEVVVESYNTVLGVAKLIEFADLIFCYDNEALGAAAVRILQCDKPGVVDNNKLVAMTMLGLTSCSRFPGQLNVSVNKLRTSMLPLPGLNFLITGLAAVPGNPMLQQHNERSVKEVAQQMLNPSHMLASCHFSSEVKADEKAAKSSDKGEAKVLAAGGIFRGRIPMQALELAVLELREKKSRLFPSFSQHDITVGSCDISPRGYSLSATFVTNQGSTVQLLQQQCDQVKKYLANGRAFFHLFQEAGITDADVQGSTEKVLESITSYDNYVSGKSQS